MELRDEAGTVIVHLGIDISANGQRLEITSASTGETRYVDALMLEVLTWLPGELLGEPPTDTAESPGNERFAKNGHGTIRREEE
ncbi:hypothetical protein ACQPZQ_30000 [Pseudonocardia sp. CA-142604]|uniref:hypothetical protein n=1 Tax=Pseudonocardia sp. CA-142604 TaxID=3240024 RepID=UPI003D8A78B6